MATHKNIIITRQFLDQTPNTYFIYGDNLIHEGYGGAAILRDHPRSIGFITKKFPSNENSSFYKPEEYSPVFFEELKKLEKIIKSRQNKTFYISQLGGGLANRYRIWEKLIQHNLTLTLEKYENVVFCWE